MKSIVIIDYEMGNVGSIKNMLKKIGMNAIVSSNKDEIENADKLILPGVGAFDNGMSQLKKLNLIELLNNKVREDKTDILGICLGMQLFTRCSQEGTLPGLGWIDAEIVRFDESQSNERLRIPHMGWNTTYVCKQSPLVRQFTKTTRFYFAHSYHLRLNDPTIALLETYYGYPFVSAIEMENIFGVQFHPEKSHKFGMQLLRNFCEIEINVTNASPALSTAAQ